MRSYDSEHEILVLDVDGGTADKLDWHIKGYFATDRGIQLQEWKAISLCLMKITLEERIWTIQEVSFILGHFVSILLIL